MALQTKIDVKLELHACYIFLFIYLFKYHNVYVLSLKELKV